jgi:exonuclease 3'-5' domain-containing protein 1
MIILILRLLGHTSFFGQIYSTTNMSTPSTEGHVELVDSTPKLQVLHELISTLPVEPPSVYIDLEGIALGRHGTLSILSLYLAPTKETYLIDIHSLGAAAFTTSINGISLKTILESDAIPKVLFDIRNDSDALFSLFQISVRGIVDLQLMELASRKGSRKFVSGLAKCIDRDIQTSMARQEEWRATKERGRQLFAPEKGGRYEVFNERPLKPGIIQYCKQDVMLLPLLYTVYNIRLRAVDEAFWRSVIRSETEERVKDSQKAGYDGNSKDKAIGWDQEDITQWTDDWNEDIMMEAMHGP